MFDDLLDANARYAESFPLADVPPGAARRFALVTCMDSRIDPLAALGLEPGEAKIFRNAGARVTPDALRSVVLATNLLGVERVAVMQHTGCAVVASEDELAGKVAAAAGQSTDGWSFEAIADPDAVLEADVRAVRDCPLVPSSVAVVGWRYDVKTGRIDQVVGP
jgi:carbonic anhydrase